MSSTPSPPAPSPVPSIRPAAERDAAALASLVHQSGPAVFNAMLGRSESLALTVLGSMTALPRHLICFSNAVVAEHEGRVVGAAVVYTRRDENEQGIRYFRQVWRALPLVRFPAALAHMLLMRWMVKPIDDRGLFLSAIAVQPEARSLGVGALLLQSIRNRTRSLGKDYIACDVETDNDRARKFYEREGFREVGRRRAGFFHAILGFEGYIRLRHDV